jgi:hypothetical protein
MSGPTTDHVTPYQQLLEKIRARTAMVGVIGLGYVGLPLALLFEEAPVGLESSLEPR